MEKIVLNGQGSFQLMDTIIDEHIEEPVIQTILLNGLIENTHITD
jgi:hypothetical protein